MLNIEHILRCVGLALIKMLSTAGNIICFFRCKLNDADLIDKQCGGLACMMGGGDRMSFFQEYLTLWESFRTVQTYSTVSLPFFSALCNWGEGLRHSPWRLTWLCKGTFKKVYQSKNRDFWPPSPHVILGHLWTWTLSPLSHPKKWQTLNWLSRAVQLLY